MFIVITTKKKYSQSWGKDQSPPQDGANAGVDTLILTEEEETGSEICSVCEVRRSESQGRFSSNKKESKEKKAKDAVCTFPAVSVSSPDFQ